MIKSLAMKHSAEKRVVRITVVASLIFAALLIFELFIIGGGLDVNASVVRKHAPWAYEPFLKLVGEHPDQFSLWGISSRDAEAGAAEAPDPLTSIAGINPDQLSVTLEAVEGTNTVVERTNTVVHPAEPDATSPVLVPVVSPTDESDDSADEEIPVG